MSLDGIEFGLAKQGATKRSLDDVQKLSLARAKKMFAQLIPKQQAPLLDPSPLVSALCPRRAGKTFLASSAALVTGEVKPGSIVVIISLTLKSLKRTYWHGGASGIVSVGRKFGLNLDLNSTDLTWVHENGSRGYLLAAETREQMEYIRGLEADLYILDECKSFAPEVLRELLDDIIIPQTVSRSARVFMIGTPGSIIGGPFYEATCTDARKVLIDENGEAVRDGAELVMTPTCQLGGGKTKDTDLWQLYNWTLLDNVRMPHQAANALRIKRRNGWADDHPTWRREYLGQWVASSEGLVYKFSEHTQVCTWTPRPDKDNPAGLPEDRGPWNIIFGLDIGFNDETAIVVAAYSSTYQELREVDCFKSPHLTVDDIAVELGNFIQKYGMPERIIADTGGLGKMVVETIRARFGLPLEAAEKREKNDHIELMNADLKTGRVKVVSGGQLAKQMASIQWDLSRDTLERLARTGRLREDPECPNDVADAFLYVYRASMHSYSDTSVLGAVPGTPEWEKELLRAEVARVRAELRARDRERLSERLSPATGTQVEMYPKVFS